MGRSPKKTLPRISISQASHPCPRAPLKRSASSIPREMLLNSFPSPETVSALLIVATIFHVFALISTSYRLWFRYRIRRLWWDDFWAAPAVLSDVFNMVSLWTLNAPLSNPYINFEALPTPALSRNSHIVSNWICILSYTCAIWFARISIVCSVVRVVPPAQAVSRAVFSAGVAFFCMWAFMFASKSVVCSNKLWYYNPTIIYCPISEWLAISEVCTDVLSDLVLVVLPLCLLWRVKLPSDKKIMVLSVFFASILVSTVSVVHTIFLIPKATFIGVFTGSIGSAVSLMVCNLLVLVTYIYRAIKSGKDLTAGLFGGGRAISSNHFTTVDLDYAGTSLFTSQTIGAGTGFTTSRPFTTTATNVSSLVLASEKDEGVDTALGTVVPSAADGGFVLSDMSHPCSPPDRVITK